MGLGGVEPPTSRLSGERSNHLSYRPSIASDASHNLRIRNDREPLKIRGTAPIYKRNRRLSSGASELIELQPNSVPAENPHHQIPRSIDISAHLILAPIFEGS